MTSVSNNNTDARFNHDSLESAREESLGNGANVLPLLTDRNPLWIGSKSKRYRDRNSVEVFAEFSEDILSQQISISVGDGVRCTNWQSQKMSVLDLARMFASVRIGPKDGAAITQGRLSGANRKAQNVVANDILMFDFDNGTQRKEIREWLTERGYFGIIWTTHSHGLSQTQIAESALASGRSRRGIDGIATLEELKSHLRETKGFTEQILETAGEFEHVQTNDGPMYVVKHAPLERFRLLLVLRESFQFFAHDTDSHAQRLKCWSHGYTALAEQNGWIIDKSCADASRMMYLPSAPRVESDSSSSRLVPELWVIGGNAFDFEGIEFPENYQPSRSTNSASYVGLSNGTNYRRSNDYVTANLLSFVARAGHDFEVAEWLRDLDDLSIVAEREGKLTFQCPNEENHSNANDPNDQGFFVSNASESPTAGFVMHCLHQSCRTMSEHGPQSTRKQDRAWYLDLVCQKYGVEDAFDLLAYCPSLSDAEKDEIRLLGAQRQIDDLGFVLTGEGRRKIIAENWFRALQLLGVELSFDEMSGRSFIRGFEDEGFGPELDDKALCQLRICVERDYSVKVTKDNAADWSLNLAYKCRFHPVRQYLDGVQPNWDGEERIDAFLTKYLGAEDNELNRAFSRLILIAAVRRVREPGCKFDTMLVLESGQGAGKSTAVQILAGGPEFFTDALPLGASGQETIELTRGAWIVECAELNGISRREIEMIKANLSRQTDRARAAYGRLVETVPRQWIIIGTTNEDKYLKDETGNRRFWPVKVGVTGPIDLVALAANRDQLFAEAAEMEALGEPITLPENLWTTAQKVQSQRRHDNPFIEHLEPELSQFDCGVIFPTEIYKFLKLPSELHQSQATRVAEAMAVFGWKKKQKKWKGKNHTMFVKSNGSAELYEVKADFDSERKFHRLSHSVEDGAKQLQQFANDNTLNQRSAN